MKKIIDKAQGITFAADGCITTNLGVIILSIGIKFIITEPWDRFQDELPCHHPQIFRHPSMNCILKENFQLCGI